MMIKVMNTRRKERSRCYKENDSPFSIHISSPNIAEYDLSNIKFIISTEKTKMTTANKPDDLKETNEIVIRNVADNDERLKGKAYLYTISNKYRLDFSIHNIQISDHSTYADLARERWFHNEEREIQFLVTSDLTISEIEIDYNSVTETFKREPGHNRMVCARKNEIIMKRRAGSTV